MLAMRTALPNAQQLGTTLANASQITRAANGATHGQRSGHHDARALHSPPSVPRVGTYIQA